MPKFVIPYRKTPRLIPPGKIVASDTETTGLQYRLGEHAFAFSFCDDEQRKGYIDWPVDPATRQVMPIKSELRMIREWAKRDDVVKVFHNAPFDIGNTGEAYGIQWGGEIHDTTCGIHVALSNLPSYELKWLSGHLLQFKKDDVQDLHKLTVRARDLARRKKWPNHEAVEADYWLCKAMGLDDGTLCMRYAVNDAERTMMLHLLAEIWREEDETGEMQEAYNFEMVELFPVIRKMCNRGLRVYPEIITEEIKRCADTERQKMKELEAFNKGPIDPAKTEQVRDLLFSPRKLNLKPLSFTAKKSLPKADQESLALYRKNPGVRTLFEWKAANKGRTSFFEPFDKFKVRNEDGEWVIYPGIKQFGKKTARLSCVSPNLQGTADAEASRSENPSQSRKPFGPRTDHVWWLFDYSQLEVRIFAQFSQEPVLLDSIANGEDFHSVITEKCWGGEDNPRAIEAAIESLEIENAREGKELTTPELVAFWKENKRLLKKSNEEIAYDWMKSFGWSIVNADKSIGKKNWRSRGKAVGFNRMFGGGTGPIMERLHCEYDEAKAFIKAYDEATPGVIGYIRTAGKAAVGRGGYVHTMYGRKLLLTKSRDHRSGHMRWDDYKAASYEVQGTAADLIKRAMIEIDEELMRRGVRAYIILQIHDELIVEVHKEDATEELAWKIKRIMEQQGDYLGFPLPVDAEVARKHWSQLEKIKWSSKATARRKRFLV